jgi:hypothetical protein
MAALPAAILFESIHTTKLIDGDERSEQSRQPDPPEW